MFISYVKTWSYLPRYSRKERNVIRWLEVNKRPYWSMCECKKKCVIKVSLYAECYSLSSLFLTMVAGLKDTMASKYFPPPAYETFENYQRLPGMSLEDFLTEFGRLVTKLKDFNLLLPEPVLTFRALKSANITKDNEKLVKATVSELMLFSMSEQLQKIMHGHSSSDSSPNTSPVGIKNKMDIVNNIENNQMDPAGVYFGRSSYWRDLHFNNSWEKINHTGR